MNKQIILQRGKNLDDTQMARLLTEKKLLEKLEIEREKLVSEFQKIKHFADPRVLEISQRLDEIVIQIFKLRR